MDKPKIIDKIRKLLTIAKCEGASEAEILNAMSHAETLMDNFQVSDADLEHTIQDDYTTIDNAKFGTSRSTLSGKIFAWESALAVYVERLTNVKCYIDHNKMGFGIKPGKGVIFYGIIEETQLAQEIYNELRSIISTIAYGLYFSAYKGEGGLYAQGFVNGLLSQLKKVTINPNNALIIRRQELIQYKQNKSDDWLSEVKKVNLRKGQALGGARGNLDAYKTGQEHGSQHQIQVNTTRKIGYDPNSI